jgi:hypothetical protein
MKFLLLSLLFLSACDMLEVNSNPPDCRKVNAEGKEFTQDLDAYAYQYYFINCASWETNSNHTETAE